MIKSYGYWFLFGSVLLFTLLSRLWRLDVPTTYIFDEDYHVETAVLIKNGDVRAFEWWHPPLSDTSAASLGHLTAIEWLHPPVSKYVIAVSIWLFGDTASGWRAGSLLMGIGITAGIMLLTKHALGNRNISLLAGLLSSLDGLMFVQSRIASNDIYATHFAIWALLSFSLYLKKRQYVWLGATGVLMGIASASKWSAAFFLMGICLILFWRSVPSDRQKIDHAYRWLVDSVAVLVLAVGVYLLLYIPVILRPDGMSHLLELHRQILLYQTSVEFTHVYQSSPVEWILNSRPVKYYVHTQGDTKSLIYNLANPLLNISWLASSMLYLFFRWYKKVGEWQRLDWVLVCYLSALLPWFFITRPVFFYHYSLAAALIPIPLAFTLYQAISSKKLWLRLIGSSTTLLIALSFCWWLPIWNGLEITHFSAKEKVYFPISSWR